MLAVPTPRGSIVLAKFAVVVAWSALIAALMFVTGLVIGVLMRLPQASSAVLLQGGLTVTVTSCLVIAVVTPFAFLASAGRGYLLPMGLTVLALLAANMMIVLGLGPYFPWAVPGLYAQGNGDVGAVSILVVVLTGVAGIAGTYLWWKYADQNR
jgi:ABC-2 type transport system permease protein